MIQVLLVGKWVFLPCIRLSKGLYEVRIKPQRCVSIAAWISSDEPDDGSYVTVQDTKTDEAGRTVSFRLSTRGPRGGKRDLVAEVSVRLHKPARRGSKQMGAT